MCRTQYLHPCRACEKVTAQRAPEYKSSLRMACVLHTRGHAVRGRHDAASDANALLRESRPRREPARCKRRRHRADSPKFPPIEDHRETRGGGSWATWGSWQLPPRPHPDTAHDRYQPDIKIKKKCTMEAPSGGVGRLGGVPSLPPHTVSQRVGNHFPAIPRSHFLLNSS